MALRIRRTIIIIGIPSRWIGGYVYIKIFLRGKEVIYALEVINEKTGRPPKDYTNSQWQQDLIRIRAVVQPSSFKKMRVIPEPRNFVGTYHGKTQYQCYCDFINDVLNSIRRGKPDYCYYIYQIAELLKYEQDRLQAEWLEEYRCFKISLL